MAKTIIRYGNYKKENFWPALLVIGPITKTFFRKAFCRGLIFHVSKNYNELKELYETGRNSPG